jgi:hypothetical protein
LNLAIILVIALTAIGAVLFPILRKSDGGNVRPFSEEGLNQEVARFRSAIKGGTLCERCFAANPAKSRFCMDCGRPITR